jgi:hypothetical protein
VSLTLYSRSNSFHDPDLTFPNKDPTCVLLRPRVFVQQGAGNTSLPTGISNSITAALSTRFGLRVPTIRKHLHQARIEEWGKVQRVDSDAGDTIHSSGLMTLTADRRDATFVRVSYHTLYLLSRHSQLRTSVCDVSG